MANNFSKLGSGNAIDTVLHPRELFAALPNKNARYQYPRDVQTEVWNQWFDRREEKDIVIRMNTGGGKTVVALLILKSCLNENKGPAVYIAPDPYLAQQVIKEAQQLGIEVTEDNRSLRFVRGKAILITTIKTLINGQSVFGVDEIKIPIGSLVIDDAHACLETTEAQFTMVVNGQAYQRLFAMFREDLRLQSETMVVEVENEESRVQMLVPYWAWMNKQAEVVALFSDIEHSSPEDGEADKYTEITRNAFRFNYPLIKNTLALCRCVFGGGVAEISPRILPTDIIPSFSNAARRIVMSATLADDSVLISHFDLNPESIIKSITPLTANDIGDRMILVPQELNTEFNDDILKTLFKGFSRSRNVVVIVPSNYRAKFWEDVADLTLRANNLEDGVNQMKSSKVGLVVLVNKYDGIDLPKTACDVLVIDGLPDVRRGLDKIDEVILYGTEQILSQRIQRIEQGMGRGVRSNDDHCLVFLMGKTLTNFLFKADATRKFGSATRAQLSLSDKMADDLHGKSLSALTEVAQQFLARDQEWIKVSKGTLANLKYEPVIQNNPITLAQRQAFTLARRNDFVAAARAINDAVNNIKDIKIKGWLRQQLAEFQQFINPTESQLILRTAIKENPRIIRPIGGIDYQRLAPSVKSQAIQCSEFIKNNFENGNRLILEVDSLLSQLIFQPDTANAFEETLKELGFIIGYNSQRPEKEFGRGPDVLWEAGDRSYFINESKNGVTSNGPINKGDCNQMNGSLVWFAKEYPGCTAIPLMIHPSNEFEYAASLPANVGIMTGEKLDAFRQAVRQFATASANATWGDPKVIGVILNDCGLTKTSFSKFLKKPVQQKR